MTDYKESIRTVDDKARPVENRLETPVAGRVVYNKYRQAMVPMARADARVITLHRGTPPYNDAELRSLGQGWRANLNLRELKGIVNHRADTAYDLHMELDTRIRVTLRPEFRDQQTPHPTVDFGRIIAEEYTHMLNFDWPENYLLLDQVSRDRIKLGLGVASWKDAVDWRPSYVPKYCFFTDPMFAPLAESIPCCHIRDTLLLRDLLPLLEPESRESAQDAGWDVEVLRKIVLSLFSKATEDNAQAEPPAVRDDTVGQWAAFEAWRASQPADEAAFELERLPVVRYLMRNVSDEKVSHYIDIDPALCEVETESFLFHKLSQFGKMSEAVWLNPYSYGEGTVGSLEGLGHDLAPYIEVSNRMLCSALDGGMMSGGLLLQANAGWDGDELSVLRVGPTTVIPPTLQAVQSSFNPPISNLLELRMALRGVYSNNVGMTRMNPELMETAARGTRSSEEVVTERRREFRIESNSANFEYMMWTNLHREMFRRAVTASTRSASLPGSKEARAFRARCLNRGVPEHILDNAGEALIVETNRAVGGGSPQAREQTWGKLLNLVGQMDEAGRRHVQRQFTASLLGYREVDTLFPVWNRDEIPSNERSIATLENNDFREGSYVPAGSDQIHTIHLSVHFELLGGMVQAYDSEEGEVDAMAILQTFAAALPNVQEHIQFLSADPTRKDFVDRAEGMLKELVMFYRRIENEAVGSMQKQQELSVKRQQQAVQEVQNQMNSEVAVKMREVELKAQLEAMKQQSIAEVRQSKTEAQNAIREQGADMKATLDREIAERKMALEEDIARRKQDNAERRTE